jgi:NADPH:quinone reductase-like Zn-dependent oxidoreductase
VVRVRAAALNRKDVLTWTGRLRLFAGGRFPRRAGYDWPARSRARPRRDRSRAAAADIAEAQRYLATRRARGKVVLRVA